MHQRRAMIIARSQDRLAPRSSTPRSADGWVLPPQWETADDRAIDRPALGGDGLSINADPHDTVLVRHDGRNNVIGILKPRRMGPGCDWSATPFLQSLAQLCAGFACFTMEPRPFAIRSTRSLQQPRTSAGGMREASPRSQYARRPYARNWWAPREVRLCPPRLPVERHTSAATAEGKRRRTGQQGRIDVAVDALGLLGVANPE